MRNRSKVEMELEKEAMGWISRGDFLIQNYFSFYKLHLVQSNFYFLKMFIFKNYVFYPIFQISKVFSVYFHYYFPRISLMMASLILCLAIFGDEAMFIWS